MNKCTTIPYIMEPVYQHRYPSTRPISSVWGALYKPLCPRMNSRAEIPTAACQGILWHSPVTSAPRITISSVMGARMTTYNTCSQALSV